MKTGPQFRRHRKMLQSAFSAAASISYRKKQEELARTLAGGLIKTPEAWNRLLVRWAMTLHCHVSLRLSPKLKVRNFRDTRDCVRSSYY